MSIENIVNSQFSAFCTEILEPTLREIALSFSVTTSEFYDTVHELTFPRTKLLAEEAVALGVKISDDDRIGYDRYTETENSQHRLYRILKRLLVTPDETMPNNAQLLSLPKIYDKFLFESMVSTYGSVAPMLGDHLFGKLNKSHVIRSLQGIEDRKHFSYPEFVLLTCLYMSISKSAVNVLNEPAETPNKKRRLKGRMRKIKECLFSEAFHYSLFRTLTDLIAKFRVDEYTALLDKHCRDYWLPPEKRELRNLPYALSKRYFLNFPNFTYPYANIVQEITYEADCKIISTHILPAHNNNSEASPSEECLTNETIGELAHTFNVEYNKVQLYQDFYFCVLPLAELISKGVVPKNLAQHNVDETTTYLNLSSFILASDEIDPITQENVKRNSDTIISLKMYCIALKVCEVLDAYVGATIESAITFLECLPEAGIAGKHTLLEYFNTL